MPDTTATAPAVPAPTEPTPTPAEPTPEPAGDQLGENGVKALKAERDARTAAEKKLTTLQKQLDAINQANESAIEKAQREATEAAAKATEYERQLLVQKVALDKGVPAAHIHRLTGTTEAELAADADELMAALNTPGTPKPDPSQGAKGGPAATGGPAQDFANIIQNMGQ